MATRICASCGRGLGEAFAGASTCPCCDGSIDRRAAAALPPSPPQVFPPLEETLQRIVERAIAENAHVAVSDSAPATAPSPSPPPADTNEAVGATQHFDPNWHEGRLAPPTVASASTSPDAPSVTPPTKPGSLTEAGLSATIDHGSQATPPSPANSETQDPVPPPDGWTGTLAGSGHGRITVQKSGQFEEAPSLVVHSRQLEFRGAAAAADSDYQLIETIGEGGIGIVYAARQSSIDRTVAVKMLKPGQTQDDRQRSKFLSEAVITGDLDHPNIVPIYDLGANQSGALFYSMKRVRGTPWNRVIKQKSLHENLEILMKTADAVAFAHSRHVVHRDLKPENVMLGDFGEVLLMDWGLALDGIGGRAKQAVRSHDPGMGGTPAYMSPEMAVGPIDRIDERSDVYLLGAILYEVLTGHPPHTGATVMACLFAAAHNEIVATERDDELMRIARHAMSTRSEDRYPSVKSFQSAIRDYESHAESVLLSSHARTDYEQAQRTHDYQDYARALYGFQQALELWTGNDGARHGVVETKAAYADTALTKGDIDLAQSLLDPKETWHAPILARVKAARADRDQRQQRLTAAKRLAFALTLLVIAVGVGAFLQIRRDRDRALFAEEQAQVGREAAVIAQNEAQEQAQIAKEQAERAEAARKVALEQTARAVEAEKQAKAAAALAEEAAGIARVAREAESYEAYVARIGLADAKIEENSFGTAVQLLEVSEQRYRGWEWGRLIYLCGLNIRSFASAGPIDAVAISPDGRRVAAAGWDFAARIWNLDGTGKPVELKYGSQYLHAVAFSPDGRQVAVGGGDPRGYVQIYDAATGAALKPLQGHEDGVLGVAYSRDGKRLLTCSYDRTARLWDLESSRELKKFVGHNWWVWSAAFAPAADGAVETEIVTAGQDGLTMVWNIETGKPGPPFRGHEGPVYAAAFSPDGRRIVSAGADKRVLLWDPQSVKPFDFNTLTDDRPVEPPKFEAFDGHSAAVRTVQFSPNGKQLVSGGHDNTIRVWDVASRTLLKTVRGHAGWVRSCTFTADGKQVASGSHDRRVLLWDVEKYEEHRVVGQRVLQGHSDAVLAAAFSPDDARLITGGRDHTARLWDVAAVKQVGQFDEGHAFLASQAAFLPARPGESQVSRMVTSGVDGTARVWDVDRGVELLRLEPAGRAGALAVSHDGRTILTGNDLNGATLWDAKTGKVLRELPPQGDEVVWVAYSPDDRLLLTGEAGGTCRLWNAEGTLVQSLRGHQDRITGAAFLDGGARLVTASGDNTVAQWDVATGRELPKLSLRHPNPVSSLAVDPAGRWALTGCSDGKVRLWNVADAREAAVLYSGESTVTADFSHDGRWAVVTDPIRRTVRLWDVETRQERAPAGDAKSDTAFLNLAARGEMVWTARFSPNDRYLLTVGGNGANLWETATANELQNYSPHGAIAAVDFSADGRQVATGSWDHSIKVWNVETNRAVLKLENLHRANVNAVQFSPAGKLILSASDDGTVRLSDLTSGKPLELTLQHGAPVLSARFNTDGTRIVTGCADRLARIWDAKTGKLLSELKGHSWGVNSVAYSRDGKWIATGGADNLAMVWNAATGALAARLEGHTAGVSSVAFSADGDRLLTGAQDGLVKLWDSQTGKELLTLKGHAEEITCVVFSHDDRYALSTGRDGTAVLWPAVDWGWHDATPSPLAPDAKTPHNQKPR